MSISPQPSDRHEDVAAQTYHVHAEPEVEFDVEVSTDRTPSAASVNPVATELHAEFPLLWEQAQAFDFAERLGGCSDPLLAEIDQAMRELWLARTNQRETA